MMGADLRPPLSLPMARPNKPSSLTAPHGLAAPGLNPLSSLHRALPKVHTCKEHPDVAPPVVSQNGHILALDGGLCPAFSVN